MIDQIKKFPRFGEFHDVSFSKTTSDWTYIKGDKVDGRRERTLYCCVNINAGGALVLVSSNSEPSLSDYRAAYDAAVADYDSKQSAVEVPK